MRVYAAYDKDGHILALSEIVEDGERVTIEPRADGSTWEKVVELTVPEGFEKRAFSELAAAYRVETGPGGERFTAR